MDKKRYNFFICSLLLLIGYLVHFLNNMPVTYGTNEDTIMRDIASGSISGYPDGHLILIKYCLGTIIAKAYLLTEELNCYGCFMLGAIMVSIMLILWRIKNVCKNNSYSLIVVLFVFVCMFWENIVNLQYSFVSAVIMATALFYYYTMDGNERGFKKEIVFVPMGIILSYCMCSNVFFIALPFWGLCMFCTKSYYKESLKIFLITCIGLLFVQGIEAYAYSSIEWRQYKEFYKCYKLLYERYGIPCWNEHIDFYTSLGMKEHDVINLERKNIYLVDELLDGRLKSIKDYAADCWRLNNYWLTDLKTSIKNLIQVYSMSEMLPLNIFNKVIIALNLYYGRENKKCKIFNAGVMTIEMSLFVFWDYIDSLVIPVIFSILLMELMLVLSSFHILIRNNRVRISNNYVIGLTAILMLCFIVHKGVYVQSVQEQKAIVNGEYIALQGYYRDNEDCVYFTNASYIEDYTDSFKLQEKRHRKNEIRLGSWISFSPVEKVGLKQYGIHEVDKALLEMDNVFLIYQNPSSRINAHYHEKYGEIQWLETDNAPMRGASMPVYKMYLTE